MLLIASHVVIRKLCISDEILGEGDSIPNQTGAVESIDALDDPTSIDSNAVATVITFKVIQYNELGVVFDYETMVATWACRAATGY